jgi:FixJ family two-component response regulator
MQSFQTTSTVYLVDPDASARSAMTEALTCEGFHVRSWAAANAFLEEYDPAEPACLVAEVMLPGIDGLQLQSILAQRDRLLPVVLMTANAEVSGAVQAMRAGAVTFLQKPVGMTELVSAIREGLQRNGVLRRQSDSSAVFRSRLGALTRRELEVLELVVVGKMNKQIAAQLGAAEKTIKVHRGRVMEKLAVRSVAELVVNTLQARSAVPAAQTSDSRQVA